MAPAATVKGAVWMATAASAVASALAPSSDTISRRFSTMSPSGTISSRPRP